jgi:hypothetical protein
MISFVQARMEPRVGPVTIAKMVRNGITRSGLSILYLPFINLALMQEKKL